VTRLIGHETLPVSSQEPSVRVARWHCSNNPEFERELLLVRIAELFLSVLTVLLVVASGGGLLFSLMQGESGVGFACSLLLLVTLAAVTAKRHVESWRTKMKEELQPARLDTWDRETLHFDVLIDVVRGSAVTGTDQGRLWFEDGALCFSGQATSFALTSDLVDFEKVTLRKDARRPFERSLLVPIASGVGSGKWGVQIDLSRPQNYPYYKQLLDGIVRLSYTPYSDELRQLPPITLGPGAFGKLRIVSLVIQNCAPLLLCGVLPVWIGFDRWMVVAFAIPIIFAWALRDGYWGARSGIRAWRDLGALR